MRPIDSLAGFYAHALAIEREGAVRYSELERCFEDHGEEILAGLCHELSVEEREEFRELLEASRPIMLAPIEAGAHGWLDAAAAAREIVYRLATAERLLDAAVDAEREAQHFLAWVARTSRDPAVRGLARRIGAEERGHEGRLNEAIEYRRASGPRRP